MSSIIVSSKSKFNKANIQHVIDLDAAVFTCNWCYGYAWDKNEGIQDHFIRGIILPGKKNLLNGFLHKSSCEILVKDLPEEDQKKIYSLHDDTMLDNIWRMLRDSSDHYEPGWLMPDQYYPVQRNYIFDCKCPLMLTERIRYSHYNSSYEAPIIIQPNAILCGSLSKKGLTICTSYGKCEFDLTSWRLSRSRFSILCRKAASFDNVQIFR